MNIFFDTEFTQFRDGELLSIGLVSDDDRQLYVEIDDARLHRRASDFCQEVVLSQFGLVPGAQVRSDKEAGERIATWLGSFEGPLRLCFDYKLDWHFLVRALEACGKWNHLQRRIAEANIANEASSDECLAAEEAYFERSGLLMRHHALTDAMALRERWRARSA